VRLISRALLIVKSFVKGGLDGIVGAMTTKKKNPHAVALGRAGGRKGGKARWEGVPAAERRRILQRASLARFKKSR
jgi:hypothetical protein